MDFDLQAFGKEQFNHRTAEVQVEEFKPFYKGDGEPIWTVRGLTGEELFSVREATDRNRTVSSLLNAAFGTKSEQVEGMKEILGLDESVPEDYSKMIEILQTGVVEPPLDRQTAVKICKVFPTMATRLKDKILELTGLGHTLGKPNGSGESNESETP